MTTYNYYTIRELAPQQHECIPDMNFGYNSGRVKNRIYLPDTFVGATYYFDGEYSNRYGTSQLDDEGHPYIDINFNDGEIGNGTVFIIAGKRYCTFPYTLEYVNVHETEIDASEIDTSNLVTKQTFDNTVERIDNDILTGDTANRTAIDQLTAATNQKFADVNTKLSGYEEEIGAVNASLQNLASEVDGYSTDIAQAVADAADAKSIAESAADDAATASAEAGEAKDAVSNLGIRVTQVETDVETAETVANQAKSTAGAAAQTASTAQSIASAAQTAAGQAQTSADDAKTAADNAQSAADEAKQAAQTNAGEITTIKEQVTAIQQKDAEQDEKIGALETTTADTTETVNTLQENFNNLNDSVGNLGQAVARVLDILSGGAGSHNSIYRGKNLGSSVTAEQYAAIAAGTFDDLYIGDYWTIGGITYRIAAFDYYLQTGDTPCTDHHAVIVPDGGMYEAAMNDSNTTDGGYYGSKLRTSGLEPAKATILSAFGADHILTHRQLLSNAVENGASSGWAWYDSQIDLMNEHMVYGSYAWGGGAQNGYDTGIDKSQLALFQARPDLIANRENWWLRDVQSATNFCGVNNGGDANLWNASHPFGVRPAFSIIG